MQKIAGVLVALAFAIEAHAVSSPNPFVAAAYQSVPAALAAYPARETPVALIRTGVNAYPAVVIWRTSDTSFFAFSSGAPNPAHVRAFPPATSPYAVTGFMFRLRARARGLVTTPDNTVLVWWID